MKDFSVILKGFSPADNVEKCFDSIVSQIGSHSFEIIVCYTPDDEDCLKRINAYKEKYDFIRSVECDSEKAHERINAAISQADGEFLFLLGADELLAPNAADEMISAANESGAVCNTAVHRGETMFVRYDNITTLYDAQYDIVAGSVLWSSKIIKGSGISLAGIEAEHELLFLLQYLAAAGATPAIVNDILVYRLNDARNDRYRLERFYEKSETVYALAEKLLSQGQTDALMIITQHIAIPTVQFTLQTKDDNYQTSLFINAQKLVKLLCGDELCRNYMESAFNINPSLLAELSLNQVRELKDIKRTTVDDDYNGCGFRKPNGHDSKAVFFAAQKEFRKGALGSTHLMSLARIWLEARSKNGLFSRIVNKFLWTKKLRKSRKA